MSDLISREVAIKALGEEPEILMGEIEEYARQRQWQADIDAIKNLPSKTGAWNMDKYRRFICDQCGEEALRKSNFCPNCGAKMIRQSNIERRQSIDILSDGTGCKSDFMGKIHG